MLERVRLHTVTLLKFYLRSRLLLSFAAVLLGLWLLGLVPFFLTGPSGDRFETLKAVSWQLQSFSWFYTAAIGLFALWTHVHQRNTSMIFTRPGAPQLWLASVFLSAIIVAVAIHGAPQPRSPLCCRSPGEFRISSDFSGWRSTVSSSRSSSCRS